MPTAPTADRLSDDQLQELMGRLREADGVELKLTVPELAHRSTVRTLGMDPLAAQIRQVFFLDTPDLALDHAGLVVRARRSQRKGDDTVVNLRPVVPSELPGAIRRSPSFAVEVDASPGGFVCSASMKGVPSVDVRETMTGSKRVGTLFSKEQRALFATYAPAGVLLDDLAILGPIFVLKLEHVPEGFARRLVAEMWLYPDGSRLLELSTKCAPGEAFEAAAEARAFLVRRGVDLAGDQQTKTRTALEHFAGHLQRAGPAGPVAGA